MGCVRTLPATFPIETPENAGNMIHANAPFEMFDNCYHAREDAFKYSGANNFTEFVNQECTHLILTVANTLRLNDDNGAPFERLHSFLQNIEKPIVMFGLGVQSQTDITRDATLPPEAIRLMRFLAERSPAVGVRGEMTQTVLNDICGVSNTHVTGCPSLFSKPEAIEKLANEEGNLIGRPSFNGTKLHLPEEKELLHRAILADHFLVEPVNKFNHRYFLDAARGVKTDDVPYFTKALDKKLKEAGKPEYLAEYYAKRYRLFRDVASWSQFNSDLVSFTYGSRFHANMASLLSGTPALWITHDARTRELTEFFHLPAMSIEEMLQIPTDEIFDQIDYSSFFDNIGALFENFNDYLALHSLPAIPVPNI